MPRPKCAKSSRLTELFGVLEDTNPAERLKALGDAIDHQEMVDTMRRHPDRFLAMRLCTDGAPWARVDFRMEPGLDELQVRFRILRRQHTCEVKPFDPHTKSFAQFCEMDQSALSRRRHFENSSYDRWESFGLRRRDFSTNELEEIFEHICGLARYFFGTGTWPFIEVLSNEQAWARIKSLRGYAVEGDPWAVKEKE